MRRWHIAAEEVSECEQEAVPVPKLAVLLQVHGAGGGTGTQAPSGCAGSSSSHVGQGDGGWACDASPPTEGFAALLEARAVPVSVAVVPRVGQGAGEADLRAGPGSA